MATGVGTTEIDFGAHPGVNEASVAVTGQTGITTGSHVEAWVVGDDTTTDHTASDHKYFPALASLVCGTPTAGVGFTIYGRSVHKLTGKFAVHYVWST